MSYANKSGNDANLTTEQLSLQSGYAARALGPVYIEVGDPRYLR